jgi:hypothetical protein
MSNHKKAIETLTTSKPTVANLVAKNEQLARLFLAIGEKDKAVDCYE